MRLRLVASVTAMLAVTLVAKADPTVVYGSSPLIATAVNGVTIDGSTYNVTFNNNVDTTFLNNLAGATDATNALDAALNGSTAAYVQAPGYTINNFNVVYSFAGGVVDELEATSYGSVGNWQVYGHVTGRGPAAQFALAPTPEPSSLALLGTGVLGLIGAAKRRFQS